MNIGVHVFLSVLVSSVCMPSGEIARSYGCESWTVKKAEHRIIDAFELWCWRRLLKVPWTARRSNQSILKEITWVFFGRNDTEAETLVLWPPHAKS